ncbi:hypothetical protein BCR33DRAFT_740302 [Rhizoclosmatium globosum]|uniref:Uncharacterized protein n=1 Tax=Rhizoclosmatium globosum TaxID=329046 RepID=A0A1Y2C0F3_9FUNG|nr:hypothetical protein BCR33DRAFT_740302 [Rhizoclosmatium globosum]|eukprot:ORY40456.1 hypothetical protein BCR33DRAFT_740302 [Rhizoclosmatium globosum]
MPIQFHHLPTEIVTCIGQQFADGTFEGMRALVRLSGTCVWILQLLVCNTALWRQLKSAAFDFDSTRTQARLDIRADVVEKWRRILEGDIGEVFALVEENKGKNSKHIVNAAWRMLQKTTLEELFTGISERLDWLLSVLMHAAVANEAFKNALASDAFMTECITNIIRVEGFLHNDYEVLPKMDGSLSKVKKEFLQLTLFLRLPLAQHNLSIHHIFDFRLISLNEWQLQSRDVEFWLSIISGCWTGFYADYRLDIDLKAVIDDPSFRRCDGPMRNIFLDLTETSKTALATSRRLPSVISFAGFGVDDFEDFEITGRVLPATRDVYMRKTYLTGLQLSWPLEGVLNEFGIVGSWGAASGTFFIWKESPA